ncbi:hypothetical protein SAMN04487865_100316, partial [Succinivibrio dextrinosolvens]
FIKGLGVMIFIKSNFYLLIMIRKIAFLKK